MIKKIGIYVVYGLAVLLIPISANAAVLDFGGRIIGAVPCTCSPYIRITFISSKGSSMGVPLSLDYLYGSQMFSKYNLPAGRQIIGKYAPTPACFDYIGLACKPRLTPPAIGTITPYVGSSL